MPAAAMTCWEAVLSWSVPPTDRSVVRAYGNYLVSGCPGSSWAVTGGIRAYARFDAVVPCAVASLELDECFVGWATVFRQVRICGQLPLHFGCLCCLIGVESSLGQFGSRSCEDPLCQDRVRHQGQPLLVELEG
jgi:hypothetical protein